MLSNKAEMKVTVTKSPYVPVSFHGTW